MLFDLIIVNTLEEKCCYIQVFQSSAKSRKVGLRYTQNEIIMLDRMDLFCAKLFPASCQQIILPDGKRLKISGHVCKSYHFSDCIDLPIDLKANMILNSKGMLKTKSMVIC